MSTMRKTLKILSFVLVALAVVLLVFDVNQVMVADATMDYVAVVCTFVCFALDLFLCAKGIGAANRPSKAEEMTTVSVATCVVNAASTVIWAVVGVTAALLPAANAIVVCVFTFVAYAVRKEALK